MKEKREKGREEEEKRKKKGGGKIRDRIKGQGKYR